MRTTTVRGLAVLAAWMCVGWQGVVQADYSTAVLADNPLGYWRFNDTTDVALNFGTEGSVYNGEYVGGTRVPVDGFTLVDGRQVTGLGAGNTALEVGNDFEEYVTIEESLLNDLPQFTLSAWVNPEARTGGRIGLFGQNDALEFGFLNPNQIQMWTPAGQVLDYTFSAAQIPDGTWFHLAAVGDGERIRLLINGAEVNPRTGYGQSSFNFNIGGGGIYDPTGNQFTGTLDEVAIWDSALTEAQIQAHVTAAKTVGGNYATTVLADSPMGYWGFNDADGTVAANSGIGGPSLNGEYVGGDRSAAGPNETYPGFAAGNRALSVEAPDDGYVTVDATPLSGLEAFTLSGWVKVGFITDPRVGLWGQNDAMEFGFINPTTIQMWTPFGGLLDFTIADEVVEDEWVHIAAVGDGEEIVLYIDGEFVAAGGTPLPQPGAPVESYGASGFFFNIGGGGIYDATGNQFVGQLDEVAVWDVALSNSQIRAHFEAALGGGGGLDGDFDGSGVLDAADIDALTGQVADGANNPTYDLNADALVNVADINVWVGDLFNSWIGDANLDGEFNSSDLVSVLASGTYEADIASVWTTGDFNGDGRTNSSDLVAALADGGYEMGPRAAVAAVPEPTSGLLFLIGLLAWVRGRR